MRARGIANLEEILEGRYRSQTGMGLGLVGTRRLMDQFNIASAPGKGTVVLLAEAAATTHAADHGEDAA